MSEFEKITIDSYNRAAGFRKQSCSTMNFWQEHFNKLHVRSPSGKYIDIGCGTGSDARMFLPSGYEYIGIDASKGLLDEARKLVAEADFREINIYSLKEASDCGFLNDSFDGFWAANSLIHIPASNIGCALSGISRVVKPKGFGFIAMREGDGEKMVEDSQGKRFFSLYSECDFKDILEKNQFEVLDSSRDERGRNNFSTGFLCYHVKNSK